MISYREQRDVMGVREDVNKLLGINKSIDMWAKFLI